MCTRVVEQMVSANVGLAKTWARRKAHGRNRQLLDDLVQEALIGVWIAAEKFNAALGFQFATYAVRWIRKRIQHWFRTFHRVIRIPDYLWTDKTFTMPDDVIVGAERLDWASSELPDLRRLELSSDLQTAMANLAPNAVSVLRLHYGLGVRPHTIREIADQMGTTFQAVHQTIGRAVKTLARKAPELKEWL